MAKNKVLKIDYWNDWSGKTYTIPANTNYNTIEIVNYPDYWTSFPIQAVGISADGKDLQIYGGNNSWIIVKGYFAKNGKHSIKKFEYNDKNTVLLDYVNSELARTGTPIISGKNNVYKGDNFSCLMNGTNNNEKMYGYGGIDRIYGGGGNDYIDGGVDNDYLYGNDGDDTIKGGIGNDYIEGGLGDDILTGGAGTNIINVSVSEAFGDDTVILSKGEILKINIDNLPEGCDDYENVHVHYVGKNMVIDVYNKAIVWADYEYGYGSIVADDFDGVKSGSITIKNYTKKDVMTKTGVLMLTGGDDDKVIKGYYNTVYMDSTHYKASSYTGSWVSDDINASAYVATDKQGNPIATNTDKVKGVTIKLAGTPAWSEDGELTYGTNYATGSIYADTITGGDGNDDIKGGKGNDTLKGGKGKNNIRYYEGDGADLYTITKGETLCLDFRDIEDIHYVYANKNKDLKIYYNDEFGKEAGSIILKNFAKKDITKEAKIYYDVYNDDGEIIDYDWDNLKTVTVETKVSKNFAGTWMNDYINAADYKLYKQGKKISTKNNGTEITAETSGYQKVKGLTLKGGAGGDDISGSIYSDTLKGDAGADYLLGGKGNDKLTGGKGNDFFIFRKNDGIDTIIDACVEDAIAVCDDEIFANAGNDLRYIQNGKNLEIFYSNDFGENNKIIVQNYFKTRDAKRIRSLYVTDSEMSTESPVVVDLSTVQFGKNVSGKYTGSVNADIIVGGSKADTVKGLDGDDEIYTLAGNDNIYGGKGKDIINAGSGSNNIYYSVGDGDDIILYGGGEDTLVFDEGIEVKTSLDDDDLLVTYTGILNGDSISNIITVKDYKNNPGVKHIKIGNDTYPVDNLCILSRGESFENLILEKSELLRVQLTDTFDGIDRTYTIKNLSSSRTFDLNFLENGRLIIDGSYLEVTADNGQKDDLIIMGEHNKVNTGDESDIVRISGAMDSGFVEDYFKQSNYNTVNTGSEDDYVLFYGYENVIDTGLGSDYALSIDSIDKSTVKNAETVRDYNSNEPYSSIDGVISSFDQGEVAGDCRLLSILQSIKDSFSDYVVISSTDDDLTVKFKNYTVDNKQNEITFSKSDLNGFKNVYGDMDVVLTDYALNELLRMNADSATVEGLSQVETAWYNVLANYIFGADKVTAAFSDPSHQAIFHVSYDYSYRLNKMWNLYQEGTLSNLTIGIYGGEDDCDYGLGIIVNHAYAVSYLDENYISLVNVWDNKDVLNLDFDKFLTLQTNAYSYGKDYYKENVIIKNYEEIRGNSYSFNTSAEAISFDVASWISADSNAEMICSNPDNNMDFNQPVVFYQGITSI